MEGWIGHILLRNCFLKHVIGGELEGRSEVTRRRRRRRKKLLYDVKKPRECWKLREEAVDGTVWRA